MHVCCWNSEELQIASYRGLAKKLGGVVAYGWCVSAGGAAARDTAQRWRGLRGSSKATQLPTMLFLTLLPWIKQMASVASDAAMLLAMAARLTPPAPIAAKLPGTTGSKSLKLACVPAADQLRGAQLPWAIKGLSCGQWPANR